MLEQICAHIHNFFDMDEHRRYYHWASGVFTISGGSITLDFLMPGQYFRIKGSRFNDGVHQYPASDLIDEIFTGDVYEMRVPAGFRALVEEITAWQTKNAAAIESPYQSESFGGYSYTLATGSTQNGANKGPGWQLTFAHRLDQYRKLC